MQQGVNALVIMTGRINMIQYFTIAGMQPFEGHPGHDVGCALHVVAGRVAPQSSPRRHALVQTGALGRLQQSDHGGNNAAVLNKVDLSLEDARKIAVKSHDEPTLDLETGLLDPADIRHQVALRVLLFAAFGQPGVLGRFNTDEHGVKSRIDHSSHEIGIIGQIDGGFRLKRDRGMPATPVGQRRQEIGLELFPVPDEIVIHKKDFSVPALALQCLQLAEDLRGVLGANPASQKRGNVAKIAMKGQPRENWMLMP